MLTYQDQKQVREIVREELSPLKTQLDKVENNIDKVLKIVTRIDDEHVLTKSKVNQHDKRITKIEKKVGLPSPSSSSVFA